MKKIFFPVFGIAAIFAGCREHDIPLDFSTKAVSDSTYILSQVPAASARQVLVEEFTGQSCPNCPAAHADLDGQVTSSHNMVNVISMYTASSGPQSNPPSGYSYDLRSDLATSIYGGIFSSVNGLPSASIDRVVDNGNLIQVGSSSWDGLITGELSAASPVNIALSSEFNSKTRSAVITATVVYTQEVNIPQSLSIVIVEDSIVDKQEITDVTSPSGYKTLDNYVFNDVFRTMITSHPAGDQLKADSTGSDLKVAGRAFRKVYNATLPVTTPAIAPQHCRVIAFVNTTNGADKHIEQSAQCRLVN